MLQCCCNIAVMFCVALGCNNRYTSGCLQLRQYRISYNYIPSFNFRKSDYLKISLISIVFFVIAQILIAANIHMYPFLKRLILARITIHTDISKFVSFIFRLRALFLHFSAIFLFPIFSRDMNIYHLAYIYLKKIA